MSVSNNNDYSPIWSTWFVDRLFIVDELSRKQKEQKRNKQKKEEKK